MGSRAEIPEEIREFLVYDKGKLLWSQKPSIRINVGSEAGHVTAKGYLKVRFRGKGYLSHRVVWFLKKNEQPPKLLDHINNIKTDNRIENLRAATDTQNQHNCKLSSANKSGVKGVHWNKRKSKWQVRVMVAGVNKHIGYYTTLGAAEVAAQQARENLHGSYANHG